MNESRSIITVDGRSIAVCHTGGTSPGIVWLGGWRSAMSGTKAQALKQWAKSKGRAFTAHDYSGHGDSGGDFTEGSISRWVSESLAVFDTFTEGRQVLVGSSMGAWIALRVIEMLRTRGDVGRIAGLVLVAPAPDFTHELLLPGFTDADRAKLVQTGRVERASAYDANPDVYTSAFLEDGAANRVMTGPIHTHCPVHILHGMADREVPFSHALKLMEHLPADGVTLSLIKDGDHRLSRPQDIALLLRAIEAMTP